MIKNLPANAGEQETQVSFLSQADSLEEEMATCCSLLAWRMPWTEEPGGLQSIGSQKSWTRLKQLNNNKNNSIDAQRRGGFRNGPHFLNGSSCVSLMNLSATF